MQRSIIGLSFLALGLAASACGSSVDPSSGSGTTTAAGTGGGSSGTGGSAAGTGGGSSTGTGGQTQQTPAYQSYVILGDSISDGGGNPPFFYDLLAKNDDGDYPEWQGKDLKTKFGDTLQIVHNAKAGAVSNGLPGQVSKLPASLPGPVLVTITIGGNDMQADIFNILQGKDAPEREKFRANISKALTELTMPDRFGPGVEVHVFEADIYDPSDGKGDFAKQKCPAPLSLLPTTPTDMFFGNWNTVVAEEVPLHGASLVSPLHTTFYGHGVGAGADRWYANDCIHPNKLGHNEIRSMFWTAITGEPAPGAK